MALSFAVRSTDAVYVVTGATGGVNKQTGERPVRQEIVQMQKTGGPAWDLFLLSLQAFQQKNQTEPLSWFQVSGKFYS